MNATQTRHKGKKANEINARWRICNPLFAELLDERDAVKGDHGQAVIEVHLRGGDALRGVGPCAMHIGRVADMSADGCDVVRLKAVIAHYPSERIQSGVNACDRGMGLESRIDRLPDVAQTLDGLTPSFIAREA